ncbi:MAG: YlcI/YnfO family protein [Rhodoferax sp.]|uniref:YlcI/YnfO family protein n=1 Tax=Rhodoferax sp. TaxID=50421 RepID=UPI003267E5C8
MKTATLPSIRVAPEFRAVVESLLAEDETLTEFVENSVRLAVAQRSHQSAFVARGLASLDDAKRHGEYVDADTVVAKLQQRLAAAKKQVQTSQA